MIRILLACDDEDPDMGIYFSACADHIKTESSSLQPHIREIRSRGLTIPYIDATIEALNGTKFLCIVYSHGDRKRFIARETFIVEGGTEKFSKSIFYTFSCHTGNDIGVDIVKRGCSLFWGYTSEATIVLGYLDIFVCCANFGLLELFKGKSAGDAYLAMKGNYTKTIDDLYETEFIVASALMQNRDGMILLGSRDITLNDYFSP